MKLKIEKFSKFLLDFTNVRFIEFINKKNVILDIGCGEGEFLIKLANLYPNKQFLGVEIKYGRIILKVVVFGRQQKIAKTVYRVVLFTCVHYEYIVYTHWFSCFVRQFFMPSRSTDKLCLFATL